MISKKAVQKGAEIVVLPECFNCPYATEAFPEYAETLQKQSSSTLSPSIHFLETQSKLHGIYLIGGSIPEEHDGHIYNTCFVYNPTGELVAKHRKMHLFDINIPGKISFQESDTLTAGNALTHFTTNKGLSIGVAICYDIRFPELSLLTTRGGECSVLVFPGAFNRTTGPLHWELLLRARAVDNQCYTIGASPALNPAASYHAWGHSCVVSPWGKVVSHAGDDGDVLVAEIDMKEVRSIREAIPVMNHRREDVYSTLAQKRK